MRKINRLIRTALIGCASSIVLFGQVLSATAVTVQVAQDKFTLDGRPTFLLGASYFDASNWRLSDLDYLKNRGFNLIRIWMGWGNGYFDDNGNIINGTKLLSLVRSANYRGMVVDVAIIGASGDYNYEKKVRNAVHFLRNEPNVIFDLMNEYNLGSGRLSDRELARLYAVAKQTNPKAVVFASNYTRWMRGNNLDTTKLRNELNTGVELVAPHLDRNSLWYNDTDIRVTKIKSYLRAINKNIPVYLQEEHRNGWRGDYFSASNFLQAATECKVSGCAGWIFHTDAGFDLRRRSYQDALDIEERRAHDRIGSIIFGR